MEGVGAAGSAHSLCPCMQTPMQGQGPPATCALRPSRCNACTWPAPARLALLGGSVAPRPHGVVHAVGIAILGAVVGVGGKLQRAQGEVWGSGSTQEGARSQGCWPPRRCGPWLQFLQSVEHAPTGCQILAQRTQRSTQRGMESSSRAAGCAAGEWVGAPPAPLPRPRLARPHLGARVPAPPLCALEAQRLAGDHGPGALILAAHRAEQVGVEIGEGVGAQVDGGRRRRAHLGAHSIHIGLVAGLQVGQHAAHVGQGEGLRWWLWEAAWAGRRRGGSGEGGRGAGAMHMCKYKSREGWGRLN